jgi:NYN domain
MQAYTTITTISHKCTSYGALTTFRAYLERNDGLNPPAHTRDVLTLHGVTLLQYPQATRASNFEKLLITDLFTFALDNPAPSTIVLITNAELSTYPISALRNRHFKIILVSQYPLAFQGLAAQASEVVEWTHFLSRPRESRVTVPSPPSPTQTSASVSSRITTARPSPRTTNVDLLTQSPRHSTAQPLSSMSTTGFSPLRQPLSTPSTFTPFMGGLGSRLPASRTPWTTSTFFPSSLGTGTWGQSTISQQQQPQQPSFAGGNISGRGPHHLHSPESGLRGAVPDLSYPQTQTHPDLNTPMSISSNSPVEMQPQHVPQVFQPSRPQQLQQLSRNFDLLISILREFRAENKRQPYRSKVGSELVQRDRMVYQRAGVAGFKEYVGIAESLGIVRLGGSGSPGKEWIELLIE